MRLPAMFVCLLARLLKNMCIDLDRAVAVPLFLVWFRLVFDQKPQYRFFTVSVFSYKKMSIALHITFTENDQTYYFASNHTPDGQYCYVRL